jgi:hypothetical protein
MEKNMTIKTIITIAILFAGAARAQQVINLNMKHDWEDSRYTINGDGTVTDTKTNLMWKRCEEGLSGSDCMTGTAAEYNWQEALELADGHSFATYSDWRLPNVKELRTIVAFDRVYKPAINSTVFPNLPGNSSHFVWSSTPTWHDNTGSDDDSWLVDFGQGLTGFQHRTSGSYVRLVRGGL